MKLSKDRSQEPKSSAIKKSRKYTAAKNCSDKRAKSRLLKTQKVTAEFHQLKVNLAESEFECKSLKSQLDKTERNEYIKCIKKIKDDTSSEKVRGGLAWPLWMLKLILEILVNGSPPASISLNIAL